MMRMVQHASDDEARALAELDRARSRLGFVTTEDRMCLIGRRHARNRKRIHIALARFVAAGHALFVAQRRTSRLIEVCHRVSRG